MLRRNKVEELGVKNKHTNKKPQERREPAGDKLHADAEGDHVLVSRDGYEQQPH